MINHGSKIKDHVEKKAKLALSATGIFFLSFFLVAREGVEMALFSFAGNYALLPLLIGLVGALILVLLIHHSLLKVRLKTLFIITLAYLILQAGFLMGYSIHEGLSAAKELDVLSANSVLYVKAFDLSNTVLYHKEGVIGVPLYVLIGWYSSPEWIQFIIQYVLTAGLFLYWYVVSNKSSKNSVPSSIKSPPAPKNQRARQNKPFSKKSKHHKTSKG